MSAKRKTTDPVETRKKAREQEPALDQNSDAEEDGGDEATSWLIALVGVDDDEEYYTYLCRADTCEMKDAMQLLYTTVHKILEDKGGVCTVKEAPLKWWRIMPLQDTSTKMTLSCTGRPPWVPEYNRDILRGLVQTCKVFKIVLEYLACMYHWNKEQRLLMAEIMLEHTDKEEETCVLGVWNPGGDYEGGATRFDDAFSQKHKPLVWLQLATDLRFIDNDIMDQYDVHKSSFKEVPPGFIEYVREYLHECCSQEGDFWCFTRADVKAAVTSYLSTKCKEMQRI